MPELAQNRQAIAIGKSEIENQGRIGGRGQGGLGFGGCRQQIRFIASGSQPLRQQLGELHIVFDNQQSHRRPIIELSGFSDQP